MYTREASNSKVHFGEEINAETDTFITRMLLFQSGVIGTLFTSFDVNYPLQARFETYEAKHVVCP